MKRDGFIFHSKTMAQVDLLSNEQAGELLKAMIAHYRGEEYEGVSQIVMLLMLDAGERMDSDKARYEETSQKRSDAGKAGAEKRWHSDGNAMANDSKRIANDSVSDSDSVSVSDLKEKCILTDTQKESPAKAEPLMPAVQEIVKYLNEKAGTHYRHTSRETADLVKARLNDHYTIDDFKRVIDVKCAEWMGTEQQKFLRPETLFKRSHFEGYLNQPMTTPKVTKFDRNMLQRSGTQKQENDELMRQILEMR